MSCADNYFYNKKYDFYILGLNFGFLSTEQPTGTQCHNYTYQLNVGVVKKASGSSFSKAIANLHLNLSISSGHW